MSEESGSPPARSKNGEAAEGSSFEASTERLSRIVEELERGDLPLERSLALFEEGVSLARLARSRIEQAERRVEELLGFDGSGKPVTRDKELPAASPPSDRREGGRG